MSFRRFSVFLLVVFCAGWIMGACGRKGDLYLPDTKPTDGKSKQQTTEKRP